VTRYDPPPDGFPKKYLLTPAELAFAVTLSAQRFSCKPKIDRFLASNISPYGSHLAGVIAELACSKVFGAKISQRISREGDKHAPDLLVNGRHCEIKASTFSGKNPMLKLTQDELMDGIDYVFVLIKFPDLCLVYPPVSAEIIKESGTVEDFGYGPRAYIGADLILQAALKAHRKAGDTLYPGGE
jgi:hypothetical protein